MPGNDVIDPRPEDQDHHEPENHDDGLRQLDGLRDLPLLPGLAELFLGRLFGAALVLGGEQLQVKDKRSKKSSSLHRLYLRNVFICSVITIIHSRRP